MVSRRTARAPIRRGSAPGPADQHHAESTGGSCLVEGCGGAAVHARRHVDVGRAFRARPGDSLRRRTAQPESPLVIAMRALPARALSEEEGIARIVTLMGMSLMLALGLALTLTS